MNIGVSVCKLEFSLAFGSELTYMKDPVHLE